MNLRVVFEGGAVAELSNVELIICNGTVVTEHDLKRLRYRCDNCILVCEDDRPECKICDCMKNEEEPQRTCTTCKFEGRDGRMQPCNICVAYSLDDDSFNPHYNCWEEK